MFEAQVSLGPDGTYKISVWLNVKRVHAHSFTHFPHDINLILIFNHNGRPVIIVGLFGETKLTDSH